MRVSFVRWLDSGSHLDFDRGWKGLSDYVVRASLDNMVAESVGFVMHEDEDVLLLGQTRDTAGQSYVGAQAIAKQNILDRRDLA